MKSNQANLLGALGLLTTLVAGCYSSTTTTIKDDCPPGQGKAFDGSGACVDLLSEIADRPRHPKKPATVSPASSAAPATTTPAVTTPQCPPGQKFNPQKNTCGIDYTDIEPTSR